MSSDSDTSLSVTQLSKIDRARVPALIAQYLPVEICIYYQVVPIVTDADKLILGMVDPEDLAALDYVGKVLAYSGLEIEPITLTFQQQQDLIAYYFSHPPDPAEVAALRAAAQTKRTTKTPEAPAVPEAAREDEPTPSTDSLTEDSDETVQQLLHSMLRRALDEKADQLFVEPSNANFCRVRYRQQGILRELFKQLSDTVRVKLITSMKQMMGMETQIVGETQTAEVDRVYKGEPLVLQLRVVPQKSKEGAILSILRGDSLVKYQQNQNNVRVSETLVVAHQTQQMVQQLHTLFTGTVDKLKQYPSKPTDDWSHLTVALDAIRAQVSLMESYQQDLSNLLAQGDSANSSKNSTKDP